MTKLSKSEVEERKKAVFDSMSPRRQKHILKKGFENWDPFEEPKDPIDIRKDKTKRTTQMLIREFLQQRSHEETYSNAYGHGAWEMCHGIINDDDRCRGMYDFASWYQDLLRREGYEE
jgi:hypothetical protein